MTLMTPREVAELMHTHGIKCDSSTVEEWIREGKLIGAFQNRSYHIKASDIDTFLDWYRWEGTAFEPGIDNETKIARLFEELKELKAENKELQKENTRLMIKAGELPF